MENPIEPIVKIIESFADKAYEKGWLLYLLVGVVALGLIVMMRSCR